MSRLLQVLPGSSSAKVAVPAAGAVAQMMGMKVGEQREVVVTLPQQWEPPQFAGVEVTLTITVKELFDRELPEVGHARHISTTSRAACAPLQYMLGVRPYRHLLDRCTGLRQCPQSRGVPPGCCRAAQHNLTWVPCAPGALVAAALTLPAWPWGHTGASASSCLLLPLIPQTSPLLVARVACQQSSLRLCKVLTAAASALQCHNCSATSGTDTGPHNCLQTQLLQCC